VKDIVTKAGMEDGLIQKLLDFNAFLDEAISSAFVDISGESENTSIKNQVNKTSTVGSSNTPVSLKVNQSFVYARNDAFQLGFKARRNKPAELIARHLDQAMRKGQGTTSDADFEALLDSALALYKFTEDKDVFRTFYHRALAKRLLLQRSASDDFEKAMLKKLKERKCGYFDGLPVY
jgi:cullin 4